MLKMSLELENYADGSINLYSMIGPYFCANISYIPEDGKAVYGIYPVAKIDGVKYRVGIMSLLSGNLSGNLEDIISQYNDLVKASQTRLTGDEVSLSWAGKDKAIRFYLLRNNSSIDIYEDHSKQSFHGNLVRKDGDLYFDGMLINGPNTSEGRMLLVELD